MSELAYMGESLPLFEDKLKNYFICIDSSSLQYPLHLHSYIELVHVLKGSVEMQIADRLWSLSEGHCAIIFPGVPHSYNSRQDAPKNSLMISNCQLKLLPLHAAFLQNQLPDKPVVHLSRINSSVSDIAWIEKRLLSVDPRQDNEIFVGALFSMYLCHLYPYIHLRPRHEVLHQNPGYDLIEYVSRHSLEEDICLTGVASKFGISPSKLSRFFTNTIKSSFTNYIRAQRLNNALFLLINTDKTITEILFECGFRNQQTFNRAFIRQFGCTPSEYRKQHTFPFSEGHPVPQLPADLLPSAALQKTKDLSLPRADLGLSADGYIDG